MNTSETLMHLIQWHANWRAKRMETLVEARLRLREKTPLGRLCARIELESAARRRTHEKRCLAQAQALILELCRETGMKY